MTTLVLFALGAWSPAQAGLVDDYAARHDWACTYGGSTTCGGPDSWYGIDASHTVILCGEGDAVDICAHTWRINGQEDLLAFAMEAWGAAMEGEMGNADWVGTPSLSSPDIWLAVLRNPGKLAALEVGRGYVQVQIEEREPCASKGLGERLDPFLRAVLPVVDKGVDPVPKALELAWDEEARTDVGEVTPELVKTVMAREETLSFPERDSFQRWTLLASEPLRCMMEIRRIESAKAAVPVAFELWRDYVQPTGAEKRAIKKHEREVARLARKGQDVDTEEETLSDEPVIAVDLDEGVEDIPGGDDIDLDELLGEDDPAPDPELDEEPDEPIDEPDGQGGSEEDEFLIDDDLEF